MSIELDGRNCPRCGDSATLLPRVCDWCSCVLGAIHRQQFARRQAGAPLDFTAFYAQRALPFANRDNDWTPVE